VVPHTITTRHAPFFRFLKNEKKTKQKKRNNKKTGRKAIKVTQIVVFWCFFFKNY